MDVLALGDAGVGVAHLRGEHGRRDPALDHQRCIDRAQRVEGAARLHTKPPPSGWTVRPGPPPSPALSVISVKARQTLRCPSAVPRFEAKTKSVSVEKRERALCSRRN